MCVSEALIGRDRELAHIERFLASDTAALALLGDAGVGKSALLDAARSLAAGWRSTRIVGVESEMQLALAGLHQLVFPLSAVVDELSEPDKAALEAVLTGTVEAPSVMGLGVALLDLLHAAAARGPMLVLIDDAQWVDDLSTQVISFAARRISADRVKFLLTVRTDVESSFIGSGFEEVRVGPIAAEAAERLLDERFPELDPASRTTVLQQAAGNPLALVELPTCVVPGGGRPAATELLFLSSVPLSSRLERVYGRRVGYLDPDTRRELLLGALDGLASGASGPPQQVRGLYRMRAVDGAIEQGLLTVDREGAVAFRHPLVRSAVIQMATPNERREAHARLADAHRGDIERRAAHLAIAVIDPDETVAGELEAASRHAIRRGGAAAAVAWLTRAAELSESPTARSRRLAEASYVAGQAGLLDAAQDLVDRGADEVPSPSTVVTSSYLALYRHGDVSATHRRVLATLDGLGPGAERETVNRLINLLLAIDQFAGDPAKWAETDAAIDRFGDRVDELALIYRDSWGDVARRGATVRDRLDPAFLRLASGEPWDVMRLAVAAYYVDVLADYRSFLSRMVDREEDAGAVTNVMTMLQLVLLDQLASGQWDAAVATGTRGIALTEEHGYELFAHQFRAFLGLLAAHRGDFDTARRHQLTIDRWARARGVGFLTGFAEAIGTSIALAEGDYEAAYIYATGIAAPGTFPPYVQQAPRMLLDLVEAALHTGRAEDARRHVEAAVALGLGDVSPRLDLIVAGAVAMTAGDDVAGELYDAALARPGAPAFPFETARIRNSFGGWLRRTRRYSRAREELSRARDEFTALSARPWAERAGAEARTGSPAADAKDTLTPQERQIAELVAAGLSNKEIGTRLFLSPRTVGAHLYRIFPKLGITSRASMRDALTMADGGPDTSPGAVMD